MDVTIVDNGHDYPRDGDETVLRPEENLGWAAGTNFGTTECLSPDHAAVVWMNNDTRLAAGFFAGLLRAWEETGAGLIGPLYDCYWNHQRPSRAVAVGAYRPRARHYAAPFVDGTCMFVPSSDARRGRHARFRDVRAGGLWRGSGLQLARARGRPVGRGDPPGLPPPREVDDRKEDLRRRRGGVRKPRLSGDGSRDDEEVGRRVATPGRHRPGDESNATGRLARAAAGSADRARQPAFCQHTPLASISTIGSVIPRAERKSVTACRQAAIS